MITRFAPSPTGLLHLGHFYSAVTAFHMAREAGGQFLLRIEDIDHERSKPEFEAAIYRDLEWSGLSWREPVMRQSARRDEYDRALDQLAARGLVYACECTRRDIKAALSAFQEGDTRTTYPGTCREKSLEFAGLTLRLDMKKAIEHLDNAELSYQEGNRDILTDTDDMIAEFGDIVLARRDIGTSYHIAVTVDDAAQAVTDIVRGADLEAETPVHVLLQKLLGLPTPRYHHHRLIRDENGKRLAKRDDARAIAVYREAGLTPADIWDHIRHPNDPAWAAIF